MSKYTKPFIYLVNSRKALAKHFFHLQQRENSDCIIVTWDKPLQGCLYFPNSIWSQTRNLLLQKAREQAQHNDYEYYIFLDDDISFLSGGIKQFERLLLCHTPKVAGTRQQRVVKKNTYWSRSTLPISMRIYQLFNSNFVFYHTFDLSVVAHHKDTIMRDLLLPYDESLDKNIHSLSTHIFQLLTRILYPQQSICFPNIVTINGLWRGDTEKGEYGDVGKYMHILLQYFRNYCNLSSAEVREIEAEIVNTRFVRLGYTLPNLVRNYCNYLSYIFYYKHKSPQSIQEIFNQHYFEYKKKLIRKIYRYQDFRN